MRIDVGARVRISNPSKTVIDWCEKELTIANPEYAKKKRMGFWTGGTPATICLYEWNGNTLVVPFGCLETLLNKTDTKYELTSNFGKSKIVWYGADIPLYDYQKKAVSKMLDVGYGILQSAAGSGKTQMGLAIAIILGRRTLWLTHTHDLLQQSMDRALQYIDKDLIGTITEGKVNIGKGITFATVQTMCNLDLDLYRDNWDCIIVDECHRVAGTPMSVTQFSHVLNHLAARFKYGLSATVHRADGMIKATYALLGPVAYAVPDEAVADKVMQVTVRPQYTNIGLDPAYLDTDGTIIYAKLINYLCDNFERNCIISLDLIANQDHSNLILSDRLAHLKWLMDDLPPELKKKAVMIDGKMTSKKAKAEREQAIEDMRTGKKKYLFASYRLAKEGLDIPCLDRLYLTTPQKDSAVIIQCIGRIARTFEGKDTPVCYDYVDGKVQMLMKMFKKRCTSYRKKKCIIEK